MISAGGFFLACFACNGLRRGFLPYSTSIWMMILGGAIFLAAGYKGGYLA